MTWGDLGIAVAAIVVGGLVATAAFAAGSRGCLRFLTFAIIAAALVALHFGMKADAARLCSNDATAYRECSE